MYDCEAVCLREEGYAQSEHLVYLVYHFTFVYHFTTVRLRTYDGSLPPLGKGRFGLFISYVIKGAFFKTLKSYDNFVHENSQPMQSEVHFWGFAPFTIFAKTITNLTNPKCCKLVIIKLWHRHDLWSSYTMRTKWVISYAASEIALLPYCVYADYRLRKNAMTQQWFVYVGTAADWIRLMTTCFHCKPVI